MSEAVSKLVEGDLSVEIPCIGRRDELGRLAKALDSFKALFQADQEHSRIEADRARETQGTIDEIGRGLSALARAIWNSASAKMQPVRSPSCTSTITTRSRSSPTCCATSSRAAMSSATARAR